MCRIVSICRKNNRVMTLSLCVFDNRCIGLVAGCLCAGKITPKLNQNLFLGASLFLMGTCLFIAPFCATLIAFFITMVLHGFFTGFLTVGKTDMFRVSFCTRAIFFSLEPGSRLSDLDRLFVSLHVLVLLLSFSS